MRKLNFNPSARGVDAAAQLEQADGKTTKVPQQENTPVPVTKGEARQTDGLAVEKNANNVDPETAAESQKAQQAAHEKELAEMQAMKDGANGTYTGVVADTMDFKADYDVDPNTGYISYGNVIESEH